MALSRAEVEHVAELAKLRLSEDEIALFADQLSAILDHAQQLNTLDTDAIPPTASVLPLRNVFAEDIPHAEMLDRSTLLRNAAESEAGQFRVQGILD